MPPGSAAESGPTASAPLPKLVVEGTRLTHKTDLLFALHEHPAVTGRRRYRYHFPVVSAEWGTLAPVPWGPSLISYPPELADAARRGYDAWLELFRAHAHYPWFVDRFHVSTQVHQAAAGRPVDLRDVDTALADLGFRHVLCVRDPATFRAARLRRLEVSGNPSQYDDLEVFVREQEAMRAAVTASALPSLVVDVSDDDVERAAEAVVAWLRQDGVVPT
ncbi:hypothetical protein [Aquipuribacter nitratireducens]|uniref:Uncharacterized protein n=1 Tax=Aquipuribacter nitratireducens TaxID=650104 RepID=A0ABW0GNY9_9MICO